MGCLFAHTQHGDSFSRAFLSGLDVHVRKELLALYHTPLPVDKPTIVVCHSEPGAWHPAHYHTSVCPLSSAAITIGRTMFETDRVPDGWPPRLQRMGEVWVPTQFHADIFVRSGGVDPSRIRVVPEAVDTHRFDPALHSPLPPHELRVPSDTFNFLSVFKWEHRKGWDALLSAFWAEFRGDERVALHVLTSSYHSSGDFSSAVQLHLRQAHDCQGMEQRMAEQLAHARDGRGFVGRAPSALDPSARLHDLELQRGGEGHVWHPTWWCVDMDETHTHAVAETRVMHVHANATDPAAVHVPTVHMQGTPQTVQLGEGQVGLYFRRPYSSLPQVRLVPTISDAKLPRLYASADAFVLPSRGEGWGRPHVEAMAMGLPIIATNWSGPTQFMTEENSIPLPTAGLRPVPDGPFAGHLMAEPSSTHLRQAMRTLRDDPPLARKLGSQAREDMLRQYSPAAVAQIVQAELDRVVHAAGLSRGSQPAREEL